MKKVEPKAELINHTRDAINILVFTKSTRLEPGTSFDDVKKMTMDDKRDHLEYMFDTIQTPFEFIHYTFHLKNVSRAFTHQLVRTRDNVYNQQSMRTVDASGFSFNHNDNVNYQQAMIAALEWYESLVHDDGMHQQDARDVLPTGIHTEITFKVNLRVLAKMAELRLCKRTQGEYQDVFKKMVALVVAEHPWAEKLLQVYCAKNAICAFPRYKECPVQQYCFDPSEIRDRIKYEWERCQHVAKPVVKNGMTM